MSRTQVFAVICGIVLVLLVLELVRRRRLREEYSWIWLLTAIGYLVVALLPVLAEGVAKAIGATRAASAFTFLGLLFLFLIAIQFSVQISRLTEHNKNLAQQIAILDSELRRLADESASRTPAAAGAEGEEKAGFAGHDECSDR